MITAELFGLLAGIGVSLLTLFTPIIRLNSVLTRLSDLLESLHARTKRCEDRLDEHDKRFAQAESQAARTAEAVKQAHHRLDEINKE
jgi:hypothetical protein